MISALCGRSYVASFLFGEFYYELNVMVYFVDSCEFIIV